jgi:hypothetical protein
VKYVIFFFTFKSTGIEADKQQAAQSTHTYNKIRMGVHHSSANKVLNNILCSLFRLPLPCLFYYGLKYCVLHYTSIWLKDVKYLTVFTAILSYKMLQACPSNSLDTGTVLQMDKRCLFYTAKDKKNLVGGSCEH